MRTPFAFGWNGGNVAPTTVTIAADGRVTIDGPPRPHRSRLSARQLAVLRHVVEAERFFSLRSVNCSDTLPDFATQFVVVRTATRSKTVRVHGDCNPRFQAVYKALSSAVGIH